MLAEIEKKNCLTATVSPDALMVNVFLKINVCIKNIENAKNCRM